MALPSSRDFTATPLAPLPAASYNNVQDAIIALYALLHNGAGSAVFANAITLNGGVTGNVSASGTITAGGVVTGSTLHALNDVLIDDDLSVGDGAVIGTALTVGTVLNVVGAATAASFTASGDCTGTDLHHTAYHRRWITPLGSYTSSLGAATNWLYGTGGGAGGIQNTAGGGSEIIFIPIPVSEGETISLNVVYSAAVNELGFTLSRLDPNTGFGGTVGTIAIGVGTGSKQSIAIATNHAVVAGHMYYLQAQNGPASGTMDIFGLELLQKR